MLGQPYTPESLSLLHAIVCHILTEGRAAGEKKMLKCNIGELGRWIQKMSFYD